MLFVVFSILTFVYIGYCLYVNSRGSLEENLQLVLLIVGTCLVLVLVIILGRWVYLYLFVSVCSLGGCCYEGVINLFILHKCLF